MNRDDPEDRAQYDLDASTLLAGEGMDKSNTNPMVVTLSLRVYSVVLKEGNPNATPPEPDSYIVGMRNDDHDSYVNIVVSVDQARALKLGGECIAHVELKRWDDP